MSPRNSRDASRGFTLIEIMTVLAIIGVMSAIAVQAYTKNIRRARKSEVVADLATIVLRENNAFALRGQYVSTTSAEDPNLLYPPHDRFMNGGSPVDTVPWIVADTGYTQAGASGQYFQGGGQVHGFDALNFMPEGGDTHCSYGVISGVGQARALDGTVIDERPPTDGFGAEIFDPQQPALTRKDWFYAVARCDLDHDGLFWNFTVSHLDPNVVDADLNGSRGEY